MLIINEKLFEIDDLINELVVEFEKFPEILIYKRAKAIFLKDSVLQEKIIFLSENQNFIAFRPELRKLQREINLNDKVYKLRLAENDIQVLLSALTKKLVSSISEDIYVDENLPLKGENRHGRHHRKSE